MSKKELINIGDLLSKGILISGGQDYDDIVVPINPPKNNNLNSPNKLKSKSFEEEQYSGFNLFRMENEELPKLVDPIFPKVGVISLVGSSDTGKSTFLRQLALSIALNHDSFIGYKINTVTRNVIYISTEDDSMSTSISLKKQIRGLYPDGNIPEHELNHLKFIFDINLGESDESNLYKILEKDLNTIGADIVIVDAFTDIFSGDINSSTKVREFLNYFSKLSREYNCLILFLHHTGKRTDKYTASKDNVLGSQAFEAKMRVLLELKHHPNDDSKRTLTITKGNYLSSDIKKYSKILRFDEEKLLFFQEEQVLTSSLSNKTYNKKEEVIPLIKELYQSKKSIREIESELKSKGYNIGKSTVSNYIKEIKRV
ncbi:AAA family ATPase [Elizabethkingia anophelis]|nr:AAA family ATPase [Elizabethkingia anophelis]